MDNHSFTIDIDDENAEPPSKPPRSYQSNWTKPTPPSPSSSSLNPSSESSTLPVHKSHSRRPSHRFTSQPRVSTGRSPYPTARRMSQTDRPERRATESRRHGSLPDSVAMSTGSRSNSNPRMMSTLSRPLPDSVAMSTGSRSNSNPRLMSTLSRPWPEPFHNDDAQMFTLFLKAEEEKRKEKKKQPDERQDLSWRRLHMSRAKLRSTATTSELLAGFAMIAMVELQINNPTEVPEWLFVVFSVCTTVLVAVHVFALMISTYLIPSVDAVSKMNERGLVDESPHERMWKFIELAWAASTVVGLFLFLVEIVVICWVKFWDFSFLAAWASTAVVVPVLVMFVGFVVYFSNIMRVTESFHLTAKLKELDEMQMKLDQVSSYGSSSA